MDKEFEDLHIEVSKFDISGSQTPSKHFGTDDMTKTHLNEYLNNFPLFKEMEKYKTIYTEKQQELLKYFVNQQIKMKQKIQELQTLAPSVPKSEPKIEFKAYQEDVDK